ncbi:unnamed protein product [Euphydryas editha]|uniref:Uncharacterized protein n=1 Tax=Euphydryas editha TaxID=104508 RepID=A0AAU9TE51_EUPED|nr:unnamed protein product [Euphydryas editha]
MFDKVENSTNLPVDSDRNNLHDHLSELRHLAAKYRNEKKNNDKDAVRCSPFTCDFDNSGPARGDVSSSTDHGVQFARQKSR